MAVASTTPAATLRVALNSLLGEHVILAAAATGAALDGRDAKFKAAAGALDANSVDIAKAIGSVYGEGAEQAYAAQRTAVAHMQMIADPLASAIVKQFPDRFTASAK